MTREQAAIVVEILNDVENFEILMDEIKSVCYQVEGEFSNFFETKLMPLMNTELARREATLAAL